MANIEERILLSEGWKGERKPKACVIGLGLIGGSWAGALAERGWSVCAIECNSESLRSAKAKGWVEEGYTTMPEKLEVDLVILATPIAFLTENLRQVMVRIAEGALITDVGSIKSEVCRETAGLQGAYFIGGHPMEGSEKQGFAYANPELFRGYPYVLTPNPSCPEELVQKFAELLQDMGARVILREAEDHDQEVALISHVPHLLSLALALAAAEGFPEGKPLELAGRSFREITRLVDSSPEMWRDILLRNSSAVLASLDIWENKLKEIREIIERSDEQDILKVFARAQAARSRVINQ